MSEGKLNADFAIVEGSSEEAANLFADGNVALMSGPFVSKISFHQTIDFDQQSGKELRKVVLHLTLPTPVLIELCQKTLAGFTENREVVVSTASTIMANLLGAPAKS